MNRKKALSKHERKMVKSFFKNRTDGVILPLALLFMLSMSLIYFYIKSIGF